MGERESIDRGADENRSRFCLPQLTPARAIALLAGAVAVQLLPSLAPGWVSFTLAGLALLLLFVRATCRAPTWFVLGFAWTLVFASSAIDKRLPIE
ncbi:MAG: hypothetical protein ABIR27_03335, partial [Dokdonella sp.]